MNRVIKIYFIIAFLTLSLLTAEQNTTKEIQNKIDNRSQELKKLRQEIEKIENRIKSSKNKAENIEENLKELNFKINLTEKLIRSLNKEEYIISSKILQSNDEISKNRVELYTLRENLSHQVQYLYKFGRTKSIEQILTTMDMNSNYNKQKYLDIIIQHQKDISTKIITIIQNLEVQQEELKQNLFLKKKIRQEKEVENITLEDDKELRKKYLKQIKKDTKSLTEELDEQRIVEKNIEKLIEVLISDKEKAKQREKELVRRRKNKSKSGDNYFFSMKGKLDWPVNGKIISKFGPAYNENTKTWSENPGIDIGVKSGTKIYPVMDGLITTITFLRGYGNIIIIDHGDDYYSVYGNLKNIKVSENEYVDESIELAVVADKFKSDSSLHFEVWGKSKQLNPEDWLK